MSNMTNKPALSDKLLRLRPFFALAVSAQIPAIASMVPYLFMPSTCGCPFSGGPNAEQYGPENQIASSAVVWHACGAKQYHDRRKAAPAGGLLAHTSFPHPHFLHPALFLADRMLGSTALKTR